MTMIDPELIDALTAGSATPEQQAKAANFIKGAIEFIELSRKAFSESVARTQQQAADLQQRIAVAEQEGERLKAEREAEERAVAETIKSILNPTRSS